MGADITTSPTNDRRTQLQLERDKIKRRVEAIQRDERRETANGQADNAHEWEESEVRDGELTGAMQELKEVDTTLQRIDQGTCGLCEVCGKPIPEARLDAMASATLCVDCTDSAES